MWVDPPSDRTLDISPSTTPGAPDVSGGGFKMNSKKAWGRLVAPLGVLVLAACAPNSTGLPGEQAGRGVRRLGGSGAHVMPMHPKGQYQKLSAPSGAQLTYRGGPIIDHVKVFTVFWGSKVQFQSELNSF